SDICMNENPAQDSASHPTAGTAPSTGALTYRDLQRTVFLGFALYLLLHFAEPLTTLLLSFLLVFILAAVLNPVVAALQARGVPRIASTLGIVLLFLALLSLLGYLLAPPLVNEVGNFVAKLNRQGALDRYHDELAQRAPWLAQQLPTPDVLMQSV